MTRPSADAVRELPNGRERRHWLFRRPTPEVEDDEASQPVQMGQPSVRDSRVAKIEVRNIGQPTQMHQPGVRDVGAAEIEVGELGQSPQIGQVGVANVPCSDSQPFELAESPDLCDHSFSFKPVELNSSDVAKVIDPNEIHEPPRRPGFSHQNEFMYRTNFQSVTSLRARR
jgi:hypothetical protein